MKKNFYLSSLIFICLTLISCTYAYNENYYLKGSYVGESGIVVYNCDKNKIENSSMILKDSGKRIKKLIIGDKIEVKYKKNGLILETIINPAKILKVTQVFEPGASGEATYYDFRDHKIIDDMAIKYKINEDDTYNLKSIDNEYYKDFFASYREDEIDLNIYNEKVYHLLALYTYNPRP